MDLYEITDLDIVSDDYVLADPAIAADPNRELTSNRPTILVCTNLNMSGPPVSKASVADKQIACVT